MEPTQSTGYPNLSKARVHPHKGMVVPTTIWTPDEIGAMFDAMHASGSRYMTRNRALVAVMYRGLLRAKETCRIMPQDVFTQENYMWVTSPKRNPKNSKEEPRIAALDDRTCDYIEDWVAMRNKIKNITPQHTLFVAWSKGLHTLTFSGINKVCKNVAKMAGLTKRMHTHSMRHSGAFRLVQEGHDIVTISKQLGHKNLQTTHIYLNHLMPHDLVRNLAGSKW